MQIFQPSLLFLCYSVLICSVYSKVDSPLPKISNPVDKSRLCLTPKCVQAASVLLDSMDLTKDPCDNFFEFACGNWIKNNPIPDDKARFGAFAKIDEDVKLKMRMIFEEGSNKSNSRSIELVRKVYEKCMDVKSIEGAASKPIHDFIKSAGGWPIITADWTGKDVDYRQLLAKASKEFSIQVFYSLSVSADIKNVTNNILNIDQGQLILGRGTRDYYLNDTAYGKQTAAYRKRIFDFARLLADDMGLKVDEAKLKGNVEELFEFERRLANITVPEEDRRNYTRLYNKWTLKKLNDTLKIVNWDTHLAAMLPEEVYSRLIKGKFSTHELIANEPEFFDRLTTLLSKTDKKTIVNFILWNLVSDMSSLLDKRFEDADQQFRAVFSGRQQKPVRWKKCVSTAFSLDMAYGAIYVREFFSLEDRAEALDMIKNLKAAFSEILDGLDWMDAATKTVAIEKVGYIMNQIGFPDYVLSDTGLDNYYQNLTISDTSASFFHYVTKITKWYENKEYFDLLKEFERGRFIANPALVNAYYSAERNSITFPAGILHPPFFHSEYPRYINYGAMGSVIGHEITHGFDDQGAQFDKLGNLKNWWNAASESKFRSKTKCMIEQYGNYVVPKINMKVNGNLTQGENVADNGGMKQAFLAYQKYVKKLGREESTLPALNLTNEQLFFASFAQFWCSKSKPAAEMLQVISDPHSPSIFRVNGVMSNSAEFSKVFKCSPGSPMNPKLKCAVW